VGPGATLLSLRKVAICGLSIDTHISYWLDFPLAGCAYIDLDLCETRILKVP
jgi:hypothetical protein